MSKKLLIFGRHGQLGNRLENQINSEKEFEYIATDRKTIDIGNIVEVIDFINRHSPDWVINASAYTAVDQAEKESELAHRINCQAPAAMAAACKTINCKFIHYSTDYVFDGTSLQPYMETDDINPMNEYGKSKAAGEIKIFQECSQSVIFRTAWVYAKSGKNFVNTMLRLAQEKDALAVVDDQHGSPTFADDLAKMTVQVIRDVEAGKVEFQPGIFHATGQGNTTWFEFCKEIMKVSGNNHVRINPISSAAFPTPRPRPSYSVLDNQKLYRVYGQKLPQWRDSLYCCLTT